MKISEERNVKFGIVEHPGKWAAIKNDDDLRRHIDKLREYPVFIGLQPMFRNWSQDFSQDLLDQLDYVLMDPQTIPLGGGKYNRIWQLDSHVEDIEVFMEQYTTHVPHEAFIKMAKSEGIKFSFGSDSRTPVAGYLPYCEEMIKKCNLTFDDMYVPGNA